MLYKNLPANRLLKTFLARLFLDGLAGIKFLLQGGFQDFTAVIEAHLYFYSNFRKLKNKREKLTQKQVGGVYQRNIAYDHYLHGKTKFSDLDNSRFS